VLLGVASRGCAGDGATGEGDFLLVVNLEIYEPLRPLLGRYAETMATVNMEVHVEAWAPGGIEDIEEIMRSIAETSELGTYEEYREQHPEFF
jgi:hypothetical protein